MLTQRLADPRLEAVLAFIKAHGQITAANVRELFNLQRSQGLRVLRSWEQRGKIVGQGRGRGVHYVLPGTGQAGVAGPRIEKEGGAPPCGEAAAGLGLPSGLPERLQVALEIAAKAGSVTRADYERTAKVPQRTATRDLAELMRLGKLRAEGRGKRRIYLLAATDSRR